MLMSSATDSAESSFTDDFMEVKVIGNVGLMLEVELFGVEGDVFAVLRSASELLFLLQ